MVQLHLQKPFLFAIKPNLVTEVTTCLIYSPILPKDYSKSL